MSKKDGMKKKRKIKKAPIIIGVIVVLFVLIAFTGSKKGETGAVVTTTRAVRGDLQESVSTSGIVQAEEISVIFAPVNGRIADITATPGDAVRSGDLLVAYDLTELESAYRQAVLQQEKITAVYDGTLAHDKDYRAKLSEADINLSVLEQQITDYKAYLKKLQEELSQNQRETTNALIAESYQLNARVSELQDEISRTKDPAALAEKTKELKEVQEKSVQNSYAQQTAGSTDYVVKMQNEISDIQERIANCESYKAKMESQKAGSESAVMDSYAKAQSEADQELADISFAQAQEDYEKGKAGVVAAFDGIVTEVTAVEGATVMEGTQLLRLESTEQVKVSFQASKWDLSKLALGQKAEITISGNVYQGSVSKIDRMASTGVSGTPMVGVQIHIDNPDDRIILGLDAKIVISTKLEQNALLIPVEAVNADKEGDFLYVVENGVAVRRAIVCGISDNTHTVVLEGISEQDEIVLSAIGNLEDGAAVIVMPDQGAQEEK